MTNGDEDPIGRNFVCDARLHIGNSHTGYIRAHGVRLAQNVFDHMVPDDQNLGIGKKAILKNFLGSELILAMDDRNA